MHTTSLLPAPRPARAAPPPEYSLLPVVRHAAAALARRAARMDQLAVHGPELGERRRTHLLEKYAM